MFAYRISSTAEEDGVRCLIEDVNAGSTESACVDEFVGEAVSGSFAEAAAEGKAGAKAGFGNRVWGETSLSCFPANFGPSPRLKINIIL